MFKNKIVEALQGFILIVLFIFVMVLFLSIFWKATSTADKVLTNMSTTVTINPANGACYQNNKPCLGVPVQIQ